MTQKKMHYNWFLLELILFLIDSQKQDRQQFIMYYSNVWRCSAVEDAFSN